MQANVFPSPSRFRFWLAIAAGLLLAVAFPKPSLAGAAWIAPGLLLFAALGQSSGTAFRLGYVAGLIFFLSSLYWLLLIPYRWHGIPFGPATGWLALSAYCALYPAVWVWLCLGVSRFTFHVSGSESADTPTRPIHPSTQALKHPSTQLPNCPGTQSPNYPNTYFAALFPASWAQRATWALACAVIWVALEMVRARFLTGFPWNFLGASQYQMLPLIQIASVTGVYGVSFLVVWFSVALACTALVLGQRPAQRSAWLAEIIVPFLVIAGLAGFGFKQLTRNAPPGSSHEPTRPLSPSLSPPGERAGRGEQRARAPGQFPSGEGSGVGRFMARALNVALVQPSIPQTLIWDPNENTNRFKRLLELSQAALATKPDLLIWPEAAMPSFDEANYRAITNLVRAHNVWMIFGADDAEPRTDKEYNYFNAAFLISPEGKLMASYRKRRLVIFGEYIPLSRWLPFMKWFTPIQGGFTSGDRPVPFELNPVAALDERRTDSPTGRRRSQTAATVNAKTSALICFEDTFPHLAREHVDDDTDFLLNLTNDGWFGESAAQWQQAAAAVFRAVENGLPLVRCANNGLTCWVDAQGRLREIYGGSGSDVYRAGFMTTQIPLLAGSQREPTFYHRHGDWFGWGCVVLTAGILGMQAKGRKK